MVRRASGLDCHQWMRGDDDRRRRSRQAEIRSPAFPGLRAAARGERRMAPRRIGALMPYDRKSGQWFVWRRRQDGSCYRDWTRDRDGNLQPAIIPGYEIDPNVTDWIFLEDPTRPVDPEIDFGDEPSETVQ